MRKSLAIERIVGSEPSSRRLAELACWFQSLYREGEAIPVLVGGAAVELYTNGAYTTGDLDFVGSVPPDVAQQLEAAGFVRRGRHWIHEGGQVFLELPGRTLEPPCEPVRIRRSNCEVLLIPAEALLADRLAAWKFWGSTVDAANALLLMQSMGSTMNGRLAARLARSLGVDDERIRLRALVRRLGGRRPTPEELTRWLEAK